MALTRFSVPPLQTLTRTLAAVAMGREEPDLVITGCRLLSTYTDRIHPDREVWVRSGRIACVQPAGAARQRFGSRLRGRRSTGRTGPLLVDGEGGLLGPGLVDPHVHIESSMMTACAYAEGALLNGTTTLFCDSHEIGNVCDAEGVEWMLEDARRAPLSIFLTVPSTVPATSKALETAGGDLTARKVGRLFDRWPEALALGEKMDFVQVAMGDERSHAILGEAIRRRRPISGHIYGREFVAAGAASGITDTHESIDREIAGDFLENGFWIFLRGGPPTTPWHSLPAAIRVITELGADPKRVCVCTDDRDADDLFLFGLDWVARQAVAAGIPPVRAIGMASLHPATRYRVDEEIGGIAPARRADLVLFNDALEPQSTWYGGELVVDRRRITPVLEKALARPYRYPKSAYTTVHLPPRRALRLVPEPPAAPVIANCIRTELPGIILFHDRVRIDPAAGGWDELRERHDLCFVAVIERHGKSGRIAHGLLRGFGLRHGAVASTVGHDAHNLIVAGSSEGDMQVAVERLRRLRGGVCAVRDGKVLAEVPLPIAGLISDRRAREVAAMTTRLKRVWVELGCTLPYMGFNLIPLSVIPEIRITDRGLVTVPGMQILPLFEPAGTGV
jgi:adenine deaminase